ncbi:AIFM3 [Branchiostoma lanceolatum]|uniref:AIFM3 protein n=1 Tax=Branchiostoma lanceolatum TaxID=7740 RepID=A0A8J9WDB2_BRALA|nr:AIFM3 [Branchiostoma lanceolatum]
MGSLVSKKGSASPSSKPQDDQGENSDISGKQGGTNSSEGGAKPLPPPDVGKPIEVKVCKVSDMQDGEMREVDVGGGKALLIKEDGEFSALGHKCTHYGAPLVKGVLCNGRVRCPWHGACFNAKTGDIEDFPGLDSLPKFEVTVENDNVVVKTNKKVLEKPKRMKEMSCHSPDNDTVYLIVGGGGAAIACAETLRQEGFKGKVVMATKEPHLPYDRPKLSKALDSTGEALALRDKNFFSVYDIEVLTEKEATSVDCPSKVVTFADGQTIAYDKLLIATGGKPRPGTSPGSDLQNVCLLRSPADGNYISQQGRGKNVVIVGTSFIGMEVAAYFAGKASSVSVVGVSSTPFGRVLGEQVGSMLRKMHEEKGVKFYMNSGVVEFKGENGKLKEVVLQSGETLPADLCVVGIGVTPNTEFLSDSGIEITKGALDVDKTMQTSQDHVFAAGDIAHFPLPMADGEKVSIGHWQLAKAHGRCAALNMLGQGVEFNSVPFFWTMQYGKSLRYAGHGAGFEDVVIEGSLDDMQFVAYYVKGDDVLAVASMNRDPVVAQAAEIMHSGRTLSRADAEAGSDSWKSQL